MKKLPKIENLCSCLRPAVTWTDKSKRNATSTVVLCCKSIGKAFPTVSEYISSFFIIQNTALTANWQPSFVEANCLITVAFPDKITSVLHNFYWKYRLLCACFQFLQLFFDDLEKKHVFMTDLYCFPTNVDRTTWDFPTHITVTHVPN